MADVEVPPHPRMNQLWERQRDLEIVWLHLEEERTTLEHEIAQHCDEVRAWAHDVHRRITEDDDALPCFA
jgi:Trm5-related predicted tRNA methylase